MSLQIVPLTADHLEGVATLLAARHRRDRKACPDLPATYEEPTATLPILNDLLAAEGASGVVALDAGRVVGYLLGAENIGLPTRAFAGFTLPRAADIDYAGHAVDPEGGVRLPAQLYTALAQCWVRRGLTGHYITTPLHREASEPWWELGFGQFITMGARTTTVRDEPAARPRPDLEIRRATTDDEGVLQDAITDFIRTFAEAPMFVPYMPETAAARRRYIAEHLADPGSPIWLAFANGQLVGLHIFQEPTSAHWHKSPLATPPRSLYLLFAYTAPEGRSTGIGAALVRHTLKWAREMGYDTCTVEWVTSSRAAHFWRRQGFQPLLCLMNRAVDSRAVWADGRS
jgi:GNAT superfamily N-acetyltransferase